MPLTKEQLLIPRYKVIAELPFKPSSDMYAVGDIITDDGKECIRGKRMI